VLEEIARLGGVTAESLLQEPEKENIEKASSPGLAELGVSEVLGELAVFLERRALAMNRLPRRYRNQYKQRIMETVSRMKRDLGEYQALLEGYHLRRQGRSSARLK
jgi:hypothetical protein